MLNGSQADCDVMDVLQNGFIQGGYFADWVDEIASKYGYILSLANLGVTVQSSYLTLLD